MNTPTDTPLATAVRQQMQALADAGWEAYADQQQQRAAELYGRALELALSIGDTRLAIQYRFWQGTSLDGAGRLRAALAALAPTLQADPAAGDAADISNTLTRYIAIAQDLPVSLRAIEKAFAQAESFLHSTGHTAWRHELLHLQAMLSWQRGMLPAALSAAQEAWAVWRNAYPCYTADSHLNWLVRISLGLRDAALARRYLAEWERQPNAMPKARELRFSCRQSELARLEGRWQEAIDWARRAAQHGDTWRLIRAFLATGECDRARELLPRLAGEERHAECGHNRYELHLLRGDYHLAAARQGAGMPPADDAFGLDFPPPPHIAHPAATRPAIARTRRAYASALRLGRDIDTRLACTRRQDDVTARLARLDAIAQWL